jgi:hypothetical protein
MSEWWTYRLGSFLLFSPRTYHRLFELYNLAIWPLQLAGVAVGLAIVALLLTNRRHRDRIIAGLLAVCWLWIAWAFHCQRYAQINWVAPWFAAVFVVQAALLVVLGTVAGRIGFEAQRSGAIRIAIAVLALSVVAYPLLAPLAGRAWTTAAAFGTAPDPTAIGTLAVLASVRGRIRWPLLAVPLLWCAVAALTLWAMGSAQALVVAATAAVALVPAVRGRRPS